MSVACRGGILFGCWMLLFELYHRLATALVSQLRKRVGCKLSAGPNPSSPWAQPRRNLEEMLELVYKISTFVRQWADRTAITARARQNAAILE